MVGVIILAAVAVLLLAAAVSAVRIVRPYQRGVVERLGKYRYTVNPGLRLIVPFVDTIRLVDMREQVVSFPPQPVITSDNLVVSIDTVLYFKVVDPVRATYEIANFLQGIEQLTVTTLRNVIGSLDLEKTLTSREEINRHLSSVLDETTGRFVDSGEGTFYNYLHWLVGQCQVITGGVTECPTGNLGAEFWGAVGVTLFFAVVTVTLEVAIGLGMAIIMGKTFKGRALLRAAVLIPWAIPTAVTARLWVYVRDDRPFAGGAPPAALFRFSRDRRGEHPKTHLAEWHGILQADAYGGLGELYAPDRRPAPITEALCWAHARRKFFELADIAANARRGKDAPPISPLALEAVKRIDAVFDLERAVNGADAAHRLAVRQADAAPLVAELERWMRAERERLSRHAPVAKAINYMLSRWPSFTRFLEDGRICLTNNAAERALRGAALGRKAWLFAGSERGGDRTAFMYTLIGTAKLNGVDPQAWLADVLARIADMPLSRLPELLPWNWAPLPTAVKAA